MSSGGALVGSLLAGRVMVQGGSCVADLGQYASHVHGQLLIASWDASRNLEMHHSQSAQTFAHAIDLGTQGPWAKILIIRDSLVTSLEVLSAIRQMGATLVREHQLVAFAWVIEPTVVGYTLLRDRYASLHKGLLETPVFDNLAAAICSVEKTLAEHSLLSGTD